MIRISSIISNPHEVILSWDKYRTLFKT